LVVLASSVTAWADWVGDDLRPGDVLFIERPEAVADVSTSTTTLPPDPVDPRTLVVGACADDVPGADGVVPEAIDALAAGSPVVPRTCGEEHRYEVFAVAELAAADAGWPGVEQVDEDALRSCTAQLEEYVGVVWTESTLDIVALAPDEARWAEGDRVVHCVLFDLGLEPIEGSTAGTGR
jgi:hypothetical protein